MPFSLFGVLLCETKGGRDPRVSEQ
jgi:hypothetical protein